MELTEVIMPYTGTILYLNVKRMVAEKPAHCDCCNIGDKNFKGGIIETGNDFYYINNAVKSFIRISDGTPFIPDEIRKKLKEAIDPADYRCPIRICKLCVVCFEKLLHLLGEKLEAKLPLSLEFPLESKPIYHENVKASEQAFTCICCNEPKKRGTGRTTFGLNRLKNLKDVCSECYVTFFQFF